jgi:hypothetical protein
MVIPTDIQTAFIAGAFFADVGRKYFEAEHRASPERSQLAYNRLRVWSVLYAALFLVPAIVVSFGAWPAWESQYWTVYAEQIRGNGYYSLFIGLFVFLVVLAGYLSSCLSFRWVIEGRIKLLRIVYISVLVITFGIYMIQWPGPIRLGSVAQFRTDPYSLPYIWQDKVFFIIYILLLAYCAAPVVYGFFYFRKKKSPE